MKTAIVVGQNYPDKTLESIIEQCPRVIIFEPLPEAADACRQTCAAIPGVFVIQAACGKFFGNSKLNIYNTNGLSSSLGEISADAEQVYGGRYDLSSRGTIAVQVVHLGFMLRMFGVDFIDLLLIDAQGMDFTILKTVEQWIAESRIGTIQLEADGNGFRHYSGLPDNSDESINEWMKQFPQYAASRRPDRLLEQPDLVFELTAIDTRKHTC
jgi:FkbM family methyltransferase